jgi:hypothetical protein
MFGSHPTRWLAAYAEGLLPSGHAGQIAGHVLCCPRCRRALELVRDGQAAAARLPLHDAAPTWSELVPLLDAPPPPASLPFRWALAVVTAVAALVGGLAWRGQGAKEAQASAPLEALAVEAHLTGACELRTDDPEVARRWLAEGGLAVSPPPSTAEHRLLGAARLEGGAVALGYRLAGEPVTLVIGAAAATAERKRINRRTEGALEVSTWTRSNRAYALVSRLRAGVTCTLCHAAGSPALL